MRKDVKTVASWDLSRIFPAMGYEHLSIESPFLNNAFKRASLK
jgi:hypothetical protein